MPFDDLRLTALETANNGAVVQYKVETETNHKAGSSILVLAYLTQAEQLTDENELIQLANAMRNANNRATYNIKGKFTVLRGGL
jgi:plasmid rolling circle replication initiator protein Rep